MIYLRIIKSCKATNVKFLILKEHLDLCCYGVICDEQEFILIPEIQDDIEKLKVPIEIKSPKKDENTTDWYDKDKFEAILYNVDSNKFNHKNKIGKFRYTDIRDTINNIKNNIISETLGRNKLNAFSKIKKAAIRNNHLISSQKELSKFFNDFFDTILTENNSNINSNSNSDSDNDSDRDSNTDNSNNDNDDSNNSNKINSDKDNDNNNDNVSDNDNDYKSYEDHTIMQLHDYLKMISETKSSEEQIKL